MEAPARKVTFKVAASLAILVAAIMASLDTNEGRAYVPYWDQLGEVWTVCRGVTGAEVTPGKQYTSAECDALEGTYVRQMLSQMGDCVSGQLTFSEIKAWGDFAYNVGTDAFCNSTAAHLLSAGKNKDACAQISRWYKAGGKDCRARENNCYGIVKRRLWERQTCEKEL